MELTNTNVRYLLTIYHLSQARLEVSSKDIAQTPVSYTHLTLPTT